MIKDFWDERYSQAEFVYGTEPNDFLKAEASRLPLGCVLCLAEGQGRNAVYLAILGYDVWAVDQSAVGLAKAHELAAANGVTIRTEVANLESFEISPAAWDGIVSFSAHLPPTVRQNIHRQVVAGLKPGGGIILEAYTVAQLESSGVGGPPPTQKELYMSLAALKEELSGLEFEIGREIERDVNEGAAHRGRSAVVQVVATKPLA
ncbi:MAG: class I SAM-dependent methyltransferase [Cyanobacteria bacterium P01_F01_bin.33]